MARDSELSQAQRSRKLLEIMLSHRLATGAYSYGEAKVVTMEGEQLKCLTFHTGELLHRAGSEDLFGMVP